MNSLKNLALFGGKKTREKSFPKHPQITDEEKQAVIEVLDSGNLSTFVASAGEFFLGGKKLENLNQNLLPILVPNMQLRLIQLLQHYMQQ